MIFVRKTICSANPVLHTLGRQCNYDFGALTATNNVVHASNRLTAILNLLSG